MKKFLCILLIASLLFSVLSPIISATEYGRSVKELLSMTDAESVDIAQYATQEYVDNKLGDIETILDNIIGL